MKKRKTILGFSLLILSLCLITAAVFLMIQTIQSDNTNYEWYIKETKVYKLWKEYTGNNVTIAFLDSGISNEYMGKYSERIVHPYNLINQSNDIKDVTGHGTSMVAVSVGRFSDVGIHGIAPDALIMPVVIMNELGRTTGDLLSEGIIYAVDHGANIINLSLGSIVENQSVKVAVEYAIENEVIIVAAGGDNSNNSILYPAKYNNVIAVQAQSRLGVKYLHASTGLEIDIIMPGELIKTNALSYRTYITESGSSISTAITSGVIALLIEKRNDYNEIMNYIMDYTFEETFINIERFVMGYMS